MLTRRQAIKALCAAAMAAVAPIPAMGAAITAATGKIHADSPCPCCCCDSDEPASYTVTLETCERTYVLHPTGDGTWECREPDGVFSVMADGNGRVEISGCY